MKSKISIIAVLALAPVLLTGCDSVSTLMGGKSSPDEFSVYSRAPLSIPPEFKLRPPSPGAARPQEVEPREQAEKIIWGKDQQVSAGNFLSRSGNQRGGNVQRSTQPLSPGEKALVVQSGADKADPEIRAIVNRESVVPIAGSKTIANKVLFWRDAKKEVSIIDPGKENKRIRDKQAAGKPITSEGVPVIDQEIDRGFLDKLLFN
jgi:hypothetical protein